jgi:hypothetical protein
LCGWKYGLPRDILLLFKKYYFALIPRYFFKVLIRKSKINSLNPIRLTGCKTNYKDSIIIYMPGNNQ